VAPGRTQAADVGAGGETADDDGGDGAEGRDGAEDALRRPWERAREEERAIEFAKYLVPSSTGF